MQARKEDVEFECHIKKNRIKSYNVILIIDNREVRDANDRNFLENQLKNFYHINCMVGALSIGDF